MQLLDLPSEIVFRIFLFVPAKDIVSNISLVCVNWKPFSSDEYLWKYKCLTRWGYLHRTQAQANNPKISWLSFFKSNFDKNCLSVLVLGAEGGGAFDERLLDVQKKLKVGGLVNVDTFNIRNQTPEPEVLRHYNAVLFFSYHGFNQVAIGNMLADFVDMGGGVVTCAYSNCGRGNRLEGKWCAKQYDPLSLGSTSRCAGLRLGKVHFPRHPILKGVRTFSGGEQSSHGDGTPHPNAKIVAEWTNGRPLVAELATRTGAVVVALNLYPPSDATATGGWLSSSDGGLLLANALLYSASMVV